MANTVKLKRSAVASAVPTTTQLELGELAINTNDGKLFLKRNNGTESIVQVGSSLITDNGTRVTVGGPTTLTAPNTSAAAWLTSGINLVVSPATFTDTTSSGTIGDVYINRFGAQTLAATSATTVTRLFGTYFANPVGGTNVTASNPYALGADSLRVEGTVFVAASGTGTVQLSSGTTTGQTILGGTSQTGNMTLGQSTVSQTTNIQAGATASGSTKTINIGTGGLAGSTTTITIGSGNGTSTVGVNGAVTVAGNISVTSATSRAFLGTDSGGSISLGRVDNTASAPYIDFNSGATTVDFDARIAATSGTGTAGQGTLTVTAATTAITGVLSSPLGSAAAPSYTFTGDTNTGMWSPTADTLAFSEGGVEAMRITDAGNVGIGTSAPLGRLQAVGSAYFGAGPSDATNATLAVYSDGTGISIEAFQGNLSVTKRDMWLAAYGGNVGIGALFPSAKLDVLGNFVARTDASGGNTPLNVKNDSIANNTTKSTALRFQGVDTVGTSKNVGLVQCGPDEGNYVASYLAFQTRTADALSERMRITSAGNVGIGTTSPTFRLVSANSGTDGGWLYSSGAVSILGLGGYSGASDGAFSLRYDRTTGDITFNGGSRDTPTERMRIGGSGNVTVARKILPNVQTVTSASTITPNADTDTQVSVTALAVPTTIATPSGTAVDGQKLIIRLEDNGTARAITWTTSSGAYRIVGTTLPTTTVVGKVTYVGCIYNSTDVFWDVIAVATQA